MCKWEDIRQSDGLQLPEGGDFETFHCYTGTELDLTAEPPLLGRYFYALLFSSPSYFRNIFF